MVSGREDVQVPLAVDDKGGRGQLGMRGGVFAEPFEIAEHPRDSLPARVAQRLLELGLGQGRCNAHVDADVQAQHALRTGVVQVRAPLAKERAPVRKLLETKSD